MQDRARDHQRTVPLRRGTRRSSRASRRRSSPRRGRSPGSSGRHGRSRRCPHRVRRRAARGTRPRSARSRPIRPRCSKCWSITTPLQDAEPRGELRHAVLGRRPRPAERHHVRRHRARACGRPREHGAAVVREEQRVAEPGAGDHRRQARLVPAGQEHAGRVLQRRAAAGSSASSRSSGRSPVTSPRPSPRNSSRYISVACVAERGGGRDDHDASLGVRRRTSRTATGSPCRATCPRRRRSPSPARRCRGRRRTSMHPSFRVPHGQSSRRPPGPREPGTIVIALRAFTRGACSSAAPVDRADPRRRRYR